MAKRNYKNRTLFHGDNLDFMRGMNSETVDLIATDPPFNKGKDFHATPDSLAVGAKFQDRWSWDEDVDQEWVDQIADDWPNVWYVIESARESWGDDMGAYLCYMAVRLIAMRRLLKPTGSIYLHCDPTASHYLKMLMDAIFGRKNFVNEIVWHYKSFHGNVKRYFPRKHDTLLFYVKSSGWTFNRIFNEDNSETIDFARWHDYIVNGSEILGGNMPDHDSRFVRFLNRWRRENGREPGPDDVVYEVVGQSLDTVWDIKPVDPKDKKRVGYPTQKPLALYERIILASSNEGDLVLDPFAGCATTCVAAEKRKRKWVGIDIWEDAADIVVDRLEQNGLVAPKYSRKTKKTRQRLLFPSEMHFTSKIPKRSDDGETDVPYLKTKNKLKQDEVSDGLTNQERKHRLLDTKGSACQGCGRKFDDPRYLELDHNNPRADGGSNNISNRILLCTPCNRLKSNMYTLSGLIRENKKQGYMKDPKLVEALR